MAIFTSNIKRPHYFDRQQLRADDLSLEQQYQDTRNRQLNRYLHGWGVACGALIEAFDGTIINLGEGFAVTPLGDELYIPTIEQLDLLPLIQSACANVRADCEAEIAEIDEENDLQGIDDLEDQVLYLVAMPVQKAVDARTGVPKDCGHPGNNPQYSRLCDAVCLQLICELPPLHQPQSIPCHQLQALFCEESRDDTELESILRNQLACPAAIADEENYVVLAQIEMTDTGVEIAAVSYQPRRLLIPTQVLQSYLSCLCDTPTPTPTPTLTIFPTPTFTIFPTPTFTIFPTPTATFTIFPTATFTIIPPTPSLTFTAFPTATFTPPGGVTFAATIAAPGGGVTASSIDPFLVSGVDVNVFDTVRGGSTPIDELEILSANNVESLREMGIENVLALSIADSEMIAERLDISEIQVAEFRDNALESMRRAEPINLDNNELDIASGMSMDVEEVRNIGPVRGTRLRRQGFASVADIANTQPNSLASALSISEVQAGELIIDAQRRMIRP